MKQSAAKLPRTTIGIDVGLSILWLGLMLLFVLFGPMLAADREVSDSLLPIIPFSASSLHPEQALSPPASADPETGGIFWLGTDHLGRDLLAGIVQGARSSMVVAFSAMLLSTIIGIVLGGLSGFLGNHHKAWSRAAYAGTAFWLLVTWFYVIYIHRFRWTMFPEMDGIDKLDFLTRITLFFLVATVVSVAVYVGLKYIPLLRKRHTLPLDTLTTNFTEIFTSIPRLFLILSLVAILQPGTGVFILLMGFTSWVSAARLVRGEMLRIRKQEYIEAAYALGLKKRAIFFRHALPNSVNVILVDFTFGVAGILMAESTLSFLGVGLPPETASWGKLLSNIRYDASAWWLVVFPGLAIFFTVLSIHTLGDSIKKKINTRGGELEIKQ